MMKFFPLLFLVGIMLDACQKGGKGSSHDKGIFEDDPVAYTVTPGMIDEASGLADSRSYPGHLWVQQDGGNATELTLLSHQGKILKKVFIKQVINRDWEDMAMVTDPVSNKHYVYIADVGDNNRAFPDYLIYRFPEPQAGMDTVVSQDKIAFRYPDGSHDAEAMLVDPETGDIYLFTKDDMPSRIYRMVNPSTNSSLHTAEYIGTLPFNGVTAASLDPSRGEILIRSYTEIYYWLRKSGQTLQQLLTSAPVKLNATFEPQGESICFDNNGSGFYTLSERPSLISSINLNFYPRK